jgi:hypothetical protein
MNSLYQQALRGRQEETGGCHVVALNLADCLANPRVGR